MRRNRYKEGQSLRLNSLPLISWGKRDNTDSQSAACGITMNKQHAPASRTLGPATPPVSAIAVTQPAVALAATTVYSPNKHQQLVPSSPASAPVPLQYQRLWWHCQPRPCQGTSDGRKTIASSSSSCSVCSNTESHHRRTSLRRSSTTSVACGRCTAPDAPAQRQLKAVVLRAIANGALG